MRGCGLMGLPDGAQREAGVIKAGPPRTVGQFAEAQHGHGRNAWGLGLPPSPPSFHHCEQRLGAPRVSGSLTSLPGPFPSFLPSGFLGPRQLPVSAQPLCPLSAPYQA